ncbi:chromatin modification- protein VID21 [Yamadazyma tenuis]|nr:chromatin modification- protein VID21 [Yamadazyma tenuis]
MSKLFPEDMKALVHLRNKRLKELHHISKDPLLQALGKFNLESEEFAKVHGDITKLLDLSAIESDPSQLINEGLYTNKSAKRKVSSSKPDSSKKAKKPRLIADFKDSIKNTNSQILSKDLSDVNILAVPQHYPTTPHNVSSLAELYYLTQTLPLIKLLPGAHKTLTTDSFESALLEGKIAVLYSRIEELKRQGKWSLRQPLKYQDPMLRKNKKPLKAHWDHLIREAHWMAIDFKEQTKYKKACCVSIAQAVSDYWTYGKEASCIKTKPIEFIEDKPEQEEQEQVAVEETAYEEDKKMEVDVQEDLGEELEKTGEVKEEEETAVEPDPVPTIRAETPDAAAIDVKLLLEIPPEGDNALEEINKHEISIPAKVEDKSSIFKMHLDLNDMQKIESSIIRNLPKFTAFDEEELPNLGSQALKPDSDNIIPVSKLLYPFEEDDGFFKILVKEKHIEPKAYAIPGYQKGLFGTQGHRRFNYLKPPKPPLIKNIEYRSPTIWLPQDDKYLIHYVAEFCFNWDLIAEHLSSTVASMKRYESNIERRTPWQCFERYIQLNEKFQFGDMKGPYSYQAQQWLEQAHRAQSTTKRRISPLGIGNDSIQRGHRRLRWASMFDAMRKCMRKRENQMAKMNSRRATDFAAQQVATTPKNDKVPSPAELSKLKHDRDKSIQEAYLNQQATRNRMMAAVAQQKKQQKGIGGRPQPPGAIPPNSGAPGAEVSPTNNVDNRPNSNQMLQAMNRNATGGEEIPVAPNGTSYTPEQLQKLIQIQKQRRMMQNQQFQQRTNGQGVSPPGPDVMALNQAIASPQAQQAQLTKAASASPMMGARAPPVNNKMANMPKSTGQQVQPSGNNKQRIQFAPAQVSAIINSIQQKNPNLPRDQVAKLAASYLANIQQQQKMQQQKMQQQQQQQQQQQRLQQGASNQQMQQRNVQGQPVANLTPQERSQLQMLKAARTQQQQQQQMRMTQQQQQQLAQQIGLNGSPVMANPSANNMNSSKLDYEQRKRMLLQKQQLQQQQYRQRMGQNPPPGANSGTSSTPGSGSGSSSASRSGSSSSK